MKRLNPQNERTKHRYFTYLREARRASEASVDKAAAALHRFETYTNFRDFKGYRIEQAVGFKKHLAKATNEQSGKPLSKATLHSTLSALRNFFFWLADQPGFRSRILYSSADYFNLSAKETRVATAHRERRVPTLEQIKYVLQTMPTESEVEQRNRALIAFTLLTGTRDGALASLKLKHLDLGARSVSQDAREVKTKNSKTFTTTFFPVGEEVIAIVEEWFSYLRVERLWGLDDPLFPATRVVPGTDLLYRVDGIDRKHWADAGPIRKIFKTAFEAADLPYFNPHSFRNTLARLGQQLCRSPEEMKAWSQNFGHDHVLTTFTSYGQVASDRQADIIRSLSDVPTRTEDADLDALERVLKAARRKERA